MNCKQKSGVFLNLDCPNPKTQTCTQCKKEVCDVHVHAVNSSFLCEDCFWENYLYSIQDQNDTFIDRDFVDTYPPVIISTSSSSSDTSPGGFDEGFGGGEFGGGGASAGWTEGDKQSFSDSATGDGAILGSDDTFFYS
jgi:hypothetical protein